MDPVTTAAIIGVITTATTTATQAVIDDANARPGERIGIITNNTPFALIEYSAGTKYGTWSDPATKDVLGQPKPQDLFDAWKMSGEIPGDSKELIGKMMSYTELDKAGLILFTQWIKKYLKNVDNQPGIFKLMGTGAGVEGVVIYKVKDLNPSAYFCFYIVGGGEWRHQTWAGCAIYSQKRFVNTYYNKSTDEYDLSKLMSDFRAIGNKPNLIKDIKVSKTGNTQNAMNGKWYCEITSGQTSEFVVTTDYW